MEILVLANWFPYPPDSGTKIRALNLLRHLASCHKVTLIALSDDVERDEAQKQDLISCCQEIHIVPRIVFNPYRLRAILAALSPIPRYLIDTFSEEMQRTVQHVLEATHFDIVIALEGMALYASKVRGPVRVLDDLQVSTWRDAYSKEFDLVRRVRYAPTFWKFKRMTRWFVRHCDAYMTTSERERQHVRVVVSFASTKHSAVVPNGLDLSFYNGDFGVPRPGTLIFSGSLTFHLNLWAIQFFLRDIYPLIQQRYPQAVLRITGRTDGVPLDKLPDAEGVILTGYLDDIRPAIAQSWVSVVPLTMGGGTRLKILEAMALGTPVVSTSKGAQGLEVTNGMDILIADEPTEFADAVLRLLDDSALRTKLVANGQRLVGERYDWDQIGRKLNRFLHQVIQKHRHQEAK